MKLWVITGYGSDVGVWEPEVYKNKEAAEQAFEGYRIELKGENMGEDCIVYDGGIAFLGETEVIE